MLTWTLEDIKNSNDMNGGTFFHKANIRHQRSRIYEKIFEGVGGVFFVTSEEGYDETRRYSVRQFNPQTGSIQAPRFKTGPVYPKFLTRGFAEVAAEQLSKGNG